MVEVKQGLTWEEWVKIGERIKQTRNMLLRKIVITKPRTGLKAQGYRKAFKEIEVVRDILNDLVRYAFPKKRDVERVFYGQLAVRGEGEE